MSSQTTAGASAHSVFVRVVQFIECTFILFAAALFALPAHAVTSSVGSTPGSFNVSPSGAAAYNIPINVPPGTNGMAPNLSLNYNSQGGNGLLGVGWGLAGLSAITRCPATQDVDGGMGGSVNFDINDKFCLDGQRLTLVSGTYGYAGSSYRTRIDTFQEITAYGALGNGPAYFKVRTKAGQYLEYGATVDSAIEAQGKSTVAVWALNKISDRAGNYLTITYNENNANGEYSPARIDYTGNSTTGTGTYNSVQFAYEARPDIVPMYHAGSMMRSTVRLAHVYTYAGATQVRDYRVAYDLSAATSRSRVTSVTECAWDAAWVCLAPTVLGWQNGQSGFSEVTESRIYNWVSMFSSGKYLPMDINGDGKSDLVFALPYGNDIVLKSIVSNGVGFSEVAESRIYNWVSMFSSGKYLPM
ncbi:MAG: SpvB/TcaC N-terminal domain-containing protein, partial [Pseudomonadota bacterium]